VWRQDGLFHGNGDRLRVNFLFPAGHLEWAEFKGAIMLRREDVEELDGTLHFVPLDRNAGRLATPKNSKPIGELKHRHLNTGEISGELDDKIHRIPNIHGRLIHLSRDAEILRPCADDDPKNQEPADPPRAFTRQKMTVHRFRFDPPSPSGQA